MDVDIYAEPRKSRYLTFYLYFMYLFIVYSHGCTHGHYINVQTTIVGFLTASLWLKSPLWVGDDSFLPFQPVVQFCILTVGTVCGIELFSTLEVGKG